MKNMIEVKTRTLSLKTIDEFSEMVYQTLKDSKQSKDNIMRFRLSVENAMNIWLKELGENSECSFEVRKRFGKISITVTCTGEKCNPQEIDDEFCVFLNTSLLKTLGLTTNYSYENGMNRLSFMPSNMFNVEIVSIVAAILLSIITALILRKCFPELSMLVNEQFVEPLFTASTNLLKCIASPLVFLSVLTGIYEIGDAGVLGKLGKKLLGQFVLMTFVFLFLALIILSFIVDFNLGGYITGESAQESIIGLLLQFIPSDIMSPFNTGNTMQIVFLAVLSGFGILALQDKTSVLGKVIEQMYSVVQIVMETVAKLIPFFACLSVLSFILSDNKINVRTMLVPVIAVLVLFIIIPLLVYPVIFKLRFKLNIVELYKKLLPTFIISLTTASSIAAYQTNLDTCEKELGISSNFAKFAIPLGQVIYMPFDAIVYFAVIMALSESFTIEITALQICSILLICGILAIATPPIPGGSIPIFTILFAKFNIPISALSIVIGMDLILDYITTAGNVMQIQEELILIADRTGYLDRDVLLS